VGCDKDQSITQLGSENLMQVMQNASTVLFDKKGQSCFLYKGSGDDHPIQTV